ncbi:hypothetical protein [Cetobacterium sp.]|uniref:hypothetical protein n=1 Tax=Cetobacterium sp. TaxID=2071632 RepID=UPI003F3408A4
MTKALKLSLFLGLTTLALGKVEYTENDKLRLESVETFYNNILNNGKSKTNPTPLFADGINILTKEPVEWIYPNGDKVKISNFANQQNFLRTLVSLSEVTGDSKYRDTAIDTTKYFLTNFTDKNGLYYWGGHRFVNLDTLKLEGPQDKNQVHELKNHFPYYDFLYEINPENTKQYITAFWNAHVEDWKTLDMGRHGSYSKNLDKDIFKNNIPKDIVNPSKLPILPETKGLTFINAASDLVYSAYTLNNFENNPYMINWAKTLLKQFELAKNPKTGAPVYQFSSPKQREWPPKSDSDTNSKFGDRASRQFGPEFGDIAKEGNALFKGNAKAIVVDNALILTEIYKKTGDKDLLNWSVDTLKNFYKVAFDFETGEIKPIWNDGTDLTDYVLVRDGYYGKKGSKLTRTKPTTEEYPLALIRSYEVSKDGDLWNFARGMVNKTFNLGDIGTPDGKNINLDLNTKNASPYAIFLMTDLYNITKNDSYLKMARVIGDNIVSTKFKNGYFVENANYLNSRVDSPEALALVTLDATLKGKENSIPKYITSGGYIHGEHIEGNSVYDKNVIYKKTI